MGHVLSSSVLKVCSSQGPPFGSMLLAESERVFSFHRCYYKIHYTDRGAQNNVSSLNYARYAHVSMNGCGLAAFNLFIFM